MDTTLIIILVLVLIILLIGIIIFLYMKKRVQDFSNKIFNTPNIIEGFKLQELEYQDTPKSLSSLDSVLVPKILKDFPNINIDEMKKIAENSVISYYNSLNKRELQNMSYANNHLNNMIKEKISNIENSNVSYNKVKIHRTVINNYNNKQGSCVITFQIALEYYLKEKKHEVRTQDRLQVDMIYIYDDSLVKGEMGVSLNCKNCGAPIKVLGIKTCPYCNTGIVDYIPKVWKVNSIYEK